MRSYLSILFILNSLLVDVLLASEQSVASEKQDSIDRDISLDDRFLKILENDDVPLMDHDRRLSIATNVELVKCHTHGRVEEFGGISTPDAVAFADYGCWCSDKMNSPINKAIDGPCKGGTPVDKTDQCCLDHENDWVKAPKGCDCTEKKYDWKCVTKRASCLPGDECAKYCCDADLKFAECLVQSKKTQDNKKYWNWSSPGKCVPCVRPTETPAGPPSHTDPTPTGPPVQCDEQPCCSDCLCCGPGTVWTGSRCELADSGFIEVSCPEYETGAPEICVIPLCKEAGCCGAGTFSVPYPFNRVRGPTCFCYPIDKESPIESPTSSEGSPTGSPTS